MIAACLAIVILGTLLVVQQRSFASERIENAKERRLLMARIQAPETVLPEIPDEAPTPPAVNPESDADYWAARGLALDGSPLG